jgi:hypothetical protein
MFQLITGLSSRRGSQLEDQIRSFITDKPKIICKALNRRPVFLEKYLVSTKNRRDKNRRYRAFFAGIELIQKKPKDEFESSRQAFLDFDFFQRGKVKSRLSNPQEGRSTFWGSALAGTSITR